MKVFTYPDKKKWNQLIQRPVTDNAELGKTVSAILEKVRKKGDKAILKYTKDFDGVKLKSLLITSAEIANAGKLVSDKLKTAIQQAKKNIETFHIAQQEEVKKIETMPGVVCWRQSIGIEKVGLYIPGGSAPLFSTVLMLAVPAQIAGCKEIILCSPPSKDGTINPAILFAANICGITKIYKVGGVQAIAAMAYGTETIPKVFKILGPDRKSVV